MPAIPATINGVNVVFAPNVNNDVTSRVVTALRAVILPGVDFSQSRGDQMQRRKEEKTTQEVKQI